MRHYWEQNDQIKTSLSLPSIMLLLHQIFHSYLQSIKKFIYACLQAKNPQAKQGYKKTLERNTWASKPTAGRKTHPKTPEHVIPKTQGNIRKVWVLVNKVVTHNTTNQRVRGLWLGKEKWKRQFGIVSQREGHFWQTGVSFRNCVHFRNTQVSSGTSKVLLSSPACFGASSVQKAHPISAPSAPPHYCQKGSKITWDTKPHMHLCAIPVFNHLFGQAFFSISPFPGIVLLKRKKVAESQTTICSHLLILQPARSRDKECQETSTFAPLQAYRNSPVISYFLQLVHTRKCGSPGAEARETVS